MNEDALEYYNTKLQLYQHTYELYLHTYDEGERNIQEFKKLTLNGLRNIGMLQNCWNELSKRSIDLAEIRMTIEDQLTVQRNWNLHPSNPNTNMTGLKDVYRSREENYLGKTGQVRMEVNTVTTPVKKALVIYATTKPAPTGALIFVTECEDTHNHLGNCYACNKPGQVKRDCLEKNRTQTQAQSSHNRGQRREVICINCNKKGHMAQDCRGPKKNKGNDNPLDTEKILKMAQELLVKCNSKLEVFL